MESQDADVVDLRWNWEKITEVLSTIDPNLKVEALKKYCQESRPDSGLHFGMHFFAVRYRPGAVIMGRDTMSDYTAIHLSGQVLIEPEAVPQKTTGRGCWDNPHSRRLENLVLNVEAKAGAEGAEPQADQPRTGRFDRLLGKFYLKHPAFPLWLVDVVRRLLPTWGGKQRLKQQQARFERWATQLEKHIARVVREPRIPQALRDRIAKVKRAERELALPAPTVTGSQPATDQTAEVAAVLQPDSARVPAPLEGQIPSPAASPPLSIPKRSLILKAYDEKSKALLPVEQRFIGVTGTIWNQPRSVTLVAADDPHDGPCTLLLIKRKALLDIFKTPAGKKLLEGRLRDFVATTMPTILANNRLFRDMIYEDDVQDWNQLLDCLKGTPVENEPSTTALRQRLAGRLKEDFRSWLLERRAGAALEPADRRRVLSSLNKMLADYALAPDDLWAEELSEQPRTEAKLLLKTPANARTDCVSFRLNRLLLARAAGQGIRVGSQPWPLFPDDFKEFAKELAATHNSLHPEEPFQPRQYELTAADKKANKEKYVFQENDEGDALYLILSGMVRIVRHLPGGEAVVHNLDRNGFFGEKALSDEETPRRMASVKLLTTSYLLPIRRDVFKKMEQGESRDKFRWLEQKLLHEQDRVKTRNQLFSEGWLLPPREPPPHIADRLVLTKNILLIDMNRCTRCDQCVRGCAEAHDMQPRFHRANPELRFGHWEVAGACMNCLDAPCLEECPVGAITFLESTAVQIHRTRCIGCSKCANGCPFGVIDMYEPTSPHDAPSLAKNKTTVATKCDLCLTEKHDPPCVASCPYDAAWRVNPVEFFEGLKGRGVYAEGLAPKTPPES